ncbi:Bug family tripartite tricarboxylate transporter substrate binding protein [Bordetella petrii]|uniref:Bug family tripartite tricarboxylate transporter substrate binding protein n=1 Tax=Bordetella petrii TaxID=94624 RepID=UPI001A977CD0|nr:tripartite tricarboxylate transporter substrate binding protein [Bordetella petrii]MBO1111955.1 tripartite tricarboxylate transporter substrate binding protein [Bordetella petrii]
MNWFRIRSWRAAALAGAVSLAPMASAGAQPDHFPDRPITLVVGFSAGGSNDIVARAISQPLGRILGVPVVVENRVGAAGMIGTAHVAKADPDGYTLMVASASPVVVSPHTQAHMAYDAKKDFAAISLVGITPEALAVHPKFPAKNLAELIALAKTREITLASSGSGGLPHLAIELFKSAAPDTKIIHVPYKGAAPAVADTLAGHVDGVVVDLPAVYNHILGGRLQGIALANDARSEFLPDLPTSGEQGLPRFVAVNWIGLLAPARTPGPVIDKLHAALLAVMKQPEVRQTLAQSAVQVSVSDSPAAFQKFLNDEYEKWGEVVKASGAKAD